MTREEMKELLPIMQAWAEGKIIQFRKKGTVEWVDLYEDDLRVSSAYHYRIKPEPKYRPFKTQEECWEEMHKHHDFGWGLNNIGEYVNLSRILNEGIYFTKGNGFDFSKALQGFRFTDGTPFGIKEE